MQLMPVDVGDKVQALALRAVSFQCQHRHVRAQIRAADADVHHIGDALIGAHRLGIGQHGIERGVHLSQIVCHFRPVPWQGQPPGTTQQGVQHRALLRAVDRVATQHGIAVRFQAAVRGHVEQQGLGLPVPEVF